MLKALLFQEHCGNGQVDRPASSFSRAGRGSCNLCKAPPLPEPSAMRQRSDAWPSVHAVSLCCTSGHIELAQRAQFTGMSGACTSRFGLTGHQAGPESQQNVLQCKWNP